MNVPGRHQTPRQDTHGDPQGRCNITVSDAGEAASPAEDALTLSEERSDVYILLPEENGDVETMTSSEVTVPRTRGSRACPPEHLPCELNSQETEVCLLGGGESRGTTPTGGRVLTPRDSGYATESPAYLGTNTQFRFDEDSASFHELDDIEEDYDDVFLSPDQEQPRFILGPPSNNASDYEDNEDEESSSDLCSTSFPMTAVSGHRAIPAPRRTSLRLSDMPFTPPRVYMHQRYSTGCLPPAVVTSRGARDCVDGGNNTAPGDRNRLRLRLGSDGQENGVTTRETRAYSESDSVDGMPQRQLSPTDRSQSAPVVPGSLERHFGRELRRISDEFHLSYMSLHTMNLTRANGMMTAGRSVSNLNNNSFHCRGGQHRRFSSPSHRPTTSASFPRMQVPNGSWWQQIIQYIAPHFNQPIGNGINSSSLYGNPPPAASTTTTTAAGASPPGFTHTTGSGLSQSPSSGSAAAAARPRLQVIPSVQVQPADTPSGSEDSDSATSQESSTPTEERSNDLFTRRVCTRPQNDSKEGGSSS